VISAHRYLEHFSCFSTVEHFPALAEPARSRHSASAEAFIFMTAEHPAPAPALDTPACAAWPVASAVIDAAAPLNSHLFFLK